MIKRSQEIISCYVALCVALAGAVGVSPALHVWFEHGGHGPAHTHAGGDVSRLYPHKHSHPHSHSHDGSFADFSTSRAPIRTRPGEARPLTLFGLEVKDIFRAVGRLLASAANQDSSSPAPDESGHTHHSLPQMLASGTVESTVEISSFLFAPENFVFLFSHAGVRPAGNDLYAPTASRGPPACC